MYALLTMLDN